MPCTLLLKIVIIFRTHSKKLFHGKNYYEQSNDFKEFKLVLKAYGVFTYRPYKSRVHRVVRSDVTLSDSLLNLHTSSDSKKGYPKTNPILKIPILENLYRVLS